MRRDRPKNLMMIKTEDRGDIPYSPLSNSLLSSVAASLQDYQDSFTFLDKNGRGWVTKTELQMVLHRHDHVIGDQDLDQLWNKYQAADGFQYTNLLRDASLKLPEEIASKLHTLRLQLKQSSYTSPTQLFYQFDSKYCCFYLI